MRLSPPLLMAGGTVASRITGLARTAGLAGVLGIGLVSDAYTAASVVPTMLLVLVTGGTLSSALVPMLSRDRPDAERRRAAGTALTVLAGLAACASVALAIAAPLLARFLSLGARGQPDHDARIRLITVLLVLIAPQVFLLAVTAVTSAVLTARGRLGVVGWAPVATNVAFLVALAGYTVVVPERSEDVPWQGLLVLGLGSTVATAAGSVIQLRACRKHLPPWRELLSSRDQEVARELRRTGGWTLLYAAANQVGLLVVLAVAARRSGVGTAYQWAFTVMQLPFAVVGVTLLSASLPALARAAEDRAAFNAVVRRTAAPLLALLLPSAAALALFSALIAELLVGYGAAHDMGTALVADGISLFAVALLPFAGFQLLTRSCYALGKPGLPALSNLAVNAVTVGGSVLALRPQTAPDVLRVLVVAYAVSYLVGCLLLSAALHRAGVRPAGGLHRPLAASGVSTALGAAAVLAMRSQLPPSWLREVATLTAFGSAALAGVLPWLRGRRLDDSVTPTPVAAGSRTHRAGGR